MVKTIKIGEKFYEIVRKIAFKEKKTIKKVAEELIEKRENKL